MQFSFKHTKLACYGGYLTSAVASNFPPVLFIIFQKQFGLSLGALATLISFNFGVQMLSDLVGATFIDKIGYRISSVLANLLVALGVVLMGILPNLLTDSFLGLLIATITYAIGSGFLEVLVSPIMEAIPGDSKASNMSLLHSFYSWGQLLSIFVTTLYVAIFGGKNWWALCFFWAIIPITTALLFSKVPINSLPKEEHKSSLAMFKNKSFLLFLLLMLAAGSSEIAVSQWASLFVETALGVSKTMGDLLGPCMFALLMGIARVVYAKISDNVNLSNYIILCGTLCVISYVLMVFAKNPYISLAAVGIAGFSVGVMWPGLLSLASAKFPLGGTAMFAYLAIFGDIGCTTGPALAGAISENAMLFASPLKAGIATCTIFPILVVLLTIISKRMKVDSHA